MRRLVPHLTAWMTILVTGAMGASFLPVRPWVGGFLLAFAALRLGLWIHRLVLRWRASRD